jgi:ribosomal-protein-alanine N-acetyltransferase
MDNLTIRKGKIKDFYSLIKIVKDSFPFWIKHTPHLFISKSIIAEKDNEIAGFVAFLIKKNNAEITLMATHKNYRGQNIGSSIIKELLVCLNSLNIKSCTSKVRVDNPKALQFYKNNGFEVKKIKKRPILGDVFLIEKKLN